MSKGQTQRNQTMITQKSKKTLMSLLVGLVLVGGLFSVGLKSLPAHADAASWGNCPLLLYSEDAAGNMVGVCSGGVGYNTPKYPDPNGPGVGNVLYYVIQDHHTTLSDFGWMRIYEPDGSGGYINFNSMPEMLLSPIRPLQQPIYFGGPILVTQVCNYCAFK